MASCTQNATKFKPENYSVNKAKAEPIILAYSKTEQYSRYAKIDDVSFCQSPNEIPIESSAQHELYDWYINSIGKRFENCNYKIHENLGNEFSEILVIETCNENSCVFDFSKKMTVIIENRDF